jgi:hypothetical protein
MVVNVSKTNYIIFHTQGKKVNLDSNSIMFNSNDIDTPSPYPNLIHNLECIHDNHNDDKMQSFKLLGVFLDEHVTLNKHVAHITAKLAKTLYLLRRV